jgi:outer membrane biosynthesis protein TonB
MVAQQYRQRSLMSAIVASLLLHCLLATIATVHIYFSGNQQRNQTPLSAPELRAGHSDFGATILFKELPEAQETSKEAYPFQTPIGNSLTKQDEHTSQSEKKDAIKSVTVKTDSIKTTDPQKNGMKIAPSSQNNQQQESSVKKYGLPPKNPFARGKRDMSPALQVSLASMARGFLEHMHHQGNDAINSAGSRMPDFSDMQYVSYLQRIGRNIQESIRRNNRVFNLPHDVNGITTVQFGIGSNGNIVDIHLDNPTGVSDLDSFFKAAILDAAPFPPLPKHFNQTIFARKISFYITMPAGVHNNPRWVAH